MKIALIGCGTQAVKHIRGLRQCPGVDIVLVDRDPALARALGASEEVPWVESTEELFADPNVTAIDLCVPTRFHASFIRQALAAGKDFFCEKPLCETAAEARELHALTARAQRIGMVGYVYRYAPVFQEARQILGCTERNGESPVLGKISVALMRIGGRGSTALWKHRRSEGGGAINEMLVHMLDLAVWYFGPIVHSELVVRDLLRPRREIAGRLQAVNAEDFVIARLRTESGVPVVIQADLLTPSFTQMVQVQGDNGTLMVSIQPEMPQFLFAVRAQAGYPAGRTDLTSEQTDLYAAEMASFVAALRDRHYVGNDTLADSIHVTTALDALNGHR